MDEVGTSIGICIVAGQLTSPIFIAFMCENAGKVKLFNFLRREGLHPKPPKRGCAHEPQWWLQPQTRASSTHPRH